MPRTFVEEKKEEMRQARAGDSRAIEERDRRARLDEIRAAERDARGGGDRGRGRGRGRGGRGGRGGFEDRERPRDSGWGMRGGVRCMLSPIRIYELKFPRSFAPNQPIARRTWSPTFSPSPLPSAS